MPSALQTIELPPLDMRADIAPSSVNLEARTVDLIFSAGAPVSRYDYSTGRRYIEILSMDPAAIRMERMNTGAPLLDGHYGYSVRDQLGAVVRGTATVKSKRCIATVRFSKRADAQEVFQDVIDGIVTKVSVGYVVYAYEEVLGKGDAPTTRTATDWEPHEVSMVPMPADNDAETRSGEHTKHILTYRCVITQRDLAIEAADADRRRRFQFAQARH